MKPGKLCKRSGKRAYGSHEEAVRKAAELWATRGEIREFRTYHCEHCKCVHLTTH